MNRSSRSWFALVLAAVAGLSMLAAGCDITPDPEEVFEPAGAWSQATLDTTTTDHFRPSVAPDGTRILFITDAFAENKSVSGSNDYAVVTVPPPWSFPDLVEDVRSNPGWARIRLNQIPDDSGTLFPADETIKGDAVWLADSDGFIAIIQNNAGKERLYIFDLLPDPGSGEIPTANPRLIDDVNFASVGNRDSYHYATPAVSPNGEWLAYARYYYWPPDDTAGIPADTEFMAIYAHNLVTGETVRVTNGSSIEQDPTWSPDGNSIVFTAQIGEVGTRDLMRVSFDPTRTVNLREAADLEGGERPDPFTDGRRRLTVTAGVDDWKLPVGSFDATWMRDGRIVFTSTRRGPGFSERVRNLWIMNGDGSDQRLIWYSLTDDEEAATANFTAATSDASGLIAFTTRQNRSADYDGQKRDLWVLRNF